MLKDIVERYNLSQEEYVYIGDDVNDIECLNYAKYKITVPHAVKRLKWFREYKLQQVKPETEHSER